MKVLLTIAIIIALTSQQLCAFQVHSSLKLVNGLKHGYQQRSIEMVSIGWSQSPEHEDGIKYSNEDVSCKL